MDGTYQERWIWVCERIVPQTGTICGVEKTAAYVPAPMPGRSTHRALECNDASCTEHSARAEAFWFLYRQEDARMGRTP